MEGTGKAGQEESTLNNLQGWVEKGVLLNDWWSDVTESVQQKKKTIILVRRVENRWTFHTKRTFGSWPQCNYDLTFLSRFYKTLQIPWFGEPSIMKNPWVTPGREPRRSLIFGMLFFADCFFLFCFFFWFPVSLLLFFSLLLCFSAFPCWPVSLLFCVFLLFCFSASLLFCFSKLTLNQP